MEYHPNMVRHLVSQNGIFGIRNLRGQKPRGFVWPIQGCSCCQGLQTRANPKMSCSSAICSNAIPADQVKLDVYSPLHVGLGLFPRSPQEKVAECTALNQVLRTTQCARATHISGMCDTYQSLGFWPVLLQCTAVPSQNGRKKTHCETIWPSC